MQNVTSYVASSHDRIILVISGRCPEDFHELPKFVCTPDPNQCITDYEDHGQWRQPKTLNNLKTLNDSRTFTDM